MQNIEDLQEQLCRILTPFVPDGLDLQAETDLVADLDLDSMKVMDIVVDVEDHFDISIPLNILPDVRTIGDFVLQLQTLLKEEA
ncbi:MAG: acyl carrier protein [Desulfobacterales bacterium]|nr:MAG: acyl carrier protein [Desulfobacterales bacterium]